MANDEWFDYDLVIIGTGGAGMATAIRGDELGARVAIVEGGEEVGGTCVNVGCIPSKLLIEAAASYHEARTCLPGATADASQSVWELALARKRAVVGKLRQEKYLDVLPFYAGVSLLRGRAELLGAGRVRVGDEELGARKVVIATGATPAMPPIPGLAEAGALTSTSAMEIEKLPASMIVLGAGAIGLELGQMFARFGVTVNVLDVAPRILPSEDPELSRVLADALTEEGLTLRTSVRVTRVARHEAGYRVEVERGGARETLRAEQLLVATGRRANTSGLGLDRAGVELDEQGFVRVDEFMRTSNPDVFAAGDVTGGPQFVYVAAAGGGIAAQAALADGMGRGAAQLDLSVTPRVVFTDPQLAAVGLTEAEARAVGREPTVVTLPVAAMSRAVVSGRDRGLIKLVAEVGSNHLLGAHVVSANAGDIIGEATLAVRFGLTTDDLVTTLHPYLTWAEGLKLAAQTSSKDVAKLSCCA
ncbi:MAG: mercury(II) reductase [Truepera sp.]|jgi:mercuric reductase|nr:mercury(II) reductase [Truepera sp.]HRN19280.1 mercury(II) reductase [Trueperaceae bacterium]HRQ10059.1 mercury(II) reductase [Trueperaceae bacterium]